MSLSSTLKKNKEMPPPHLIVEARAGAGKTTTLIEGVKLISGHATELSPSPQQAAVWTAMQLSENARSICMVAFSKPIATELQQRLKGLPGCAAMTCHSMGFKAICKAFDLHGRDVVNNGRVEEIIAELTGKDIWDLRKRRRPFLNGVKKLVDLCKQTLVGFSNTFDENWEEGMALYGEDTKQGWVEQLAQLASYYDVDLDGESTEIFDMVPRVLERCKDVAKDRQIDYCDMTWLPIGLNLPMFRYDLLLVDEAQDLNRCQQALVLKAGRRLILCGDPRQAIYGFAGADTKSMERMLEQLDDTPQGCLKLMLTVTRRCGKAVVEEAKKYVPDFEAHEDNRKGRVAYASVKDTPQGYKKPFTINQHAAEADRRATVAERGVGYKQLVKDGDMIVCRVNAPLVSECFRVLKAGRKAEIQGQDIGKRLADRVKKMKATSIEDLITKLGNWHALESRKESARRHADEAKLIALQDRHDCILCFCDGAKTVADVIKKIDAVFTDDKNSKGIKLSSAHKAKGLEAENVFILMPELMPHPMAKSKWAREQEFNLLYVAITRAKDTLTYVS